MTELINFILEELLLEGLGGPDYGRVSQHIQSLAGNLHYEPFTMNSEDRLSTDQTEALWDLFRIYEQPPLEYAWVGELTEGRRKYINDWVVKILCRQAFRFDDHELICSILDLEGKYNPASSYAFLRNLKFGNLVSSELVKRTTSFGPQNTRVILAFLENQYQYHVDELELLVPWLASFLGLKPSGRGLKRVFHSDNSTKILVLFSKLGPVKDVVFETCETLCLSNEKNVRSAAEALMIQIEK